MFYLSACKKINSNNNKYLFSISYPTFRIAVEMRMALKASNGDIPKLASFRPGSHAEYLHSKHASVILGHRALGAMRDLAL